MLRHRHAYGLKRRIITTSRTDLEFLSPHHTMHITLMLSLQKDLILFTAKYGNLQFTPSSSPKVKKRQEAQNQQFTAPIKHLRYKKKFVEPSKGYYTFPISFPEIKTVHAPATAEIICNVSSVASTSNGNPTSSSTNNNWENVPEHYILLIPQYAIYEGGRLNQPSRVKVRKKKLQPLAIGSDGWLAHMKEIYDDYETMTKYEQDRIIAGIQWDTTPDQGEY
ncbi:hypothetical protein RhiirC2_800627 [Rhizophagus irregularis]|uniref:Uncharacterized protein n=1 Tax=Rhizophagus irregularis TaxID=588596 RepID=A0A2N1M3D4_9GLOM|nr:hypothetical protein RhiirC2_800627 [Rhizophagus irregularis]